MKKIHKFLIVMNDPYVMMPMWSIPKTVGMQNGSLWVWAMVDPTLPAVKHQFAVLATGQHIEPVVEQGAFIGTVFDGPFVWHVFSLGDVE